MNIIEGEGFAAYAIYNSIYLHFKSNSYDYFKYNGKTNVNKDSFSKRNDKYSFHKLSRKYSLEELKNFFIANFVDRDIKWVGELIGEEGETTYKKWLKRRDSLTYTFEEEISFLLDNVSKPDDLLKVSNMYPKLLSFWMENDIHVETVCILNDIMNFIPMWDKKIDDDIIYPTWRRRVVKYSPFIDYNKIKFKKILIEALHEQT